MYRISDDEVEFILNDIKQRGVEMEDLQLNLLDHICCILEKEKQENENFETAYQKVIKQFFKHALWEIEEETILLLKYKNYYKMKRFLYILLFISIGFNILMFSRMGYEYYKEREYFNSLFGESRVTLEEGYKDLKSTLKNESSETLKKDFICVYFVGDPMSEFEKERFPSPFIDDDTSLIRKRNLRQYANIKHIDSVAALYNKNVSFLYAYKSNHKEVIEHQRINKYLFTNGIFLNNQHKLYSGFCNERKDKAGLVHNLFVLNKNGKLVYTCNYIIDQHIFLARYLKTIAPN